MTQEDNEFSLRSNMSAGRPRVTPMIRRLKRIYRSGLHSTGRTINRLRNVRSHRTLELYQYMSRNGSFDYDRYVHIQTQGNKRKIDSLWAVEENIQFLSNILKSNIDNPAFGLCHGTRQGKEQLWFREFLDIDVIGTEISDTASQFEHTIQWDFHDTKDEWLESVDFIYSNSLDHSYDPEMCLNKWMTCLKPDGICIIEHSSFHEKATDLDPFGVSIVELPYLILEWGKGRFYVQQILDAPKQPAAATYAKFLFIRKSAPLA